MSGLKGPDYGMPVGRLHTPPIDFRSIQPPRRRTTVSSRSELFRTALAERVLVADGAMGTMLQAADPSMADFQRHEGCNEILNITRPDVVRGVHVSRSARWGPEPSCPLWAMFPLRPCVMRMPNRPAG